MFLGLGVSKSYHSHYFRHPHTHSGGLSVIVVVLGLWSVTGACVLRRGECIVQNVLTVPNGV